MFPTNINNSYNRNYYDPSIFPFSSVNFENNPTISKQQTINCDLHNSPFNFHHIPSNPFHDFYQNIFLEQTQNDFDLFQIQLPIVDIEMDVSIKGKGNKVPTNTTNKRSRTRRDRHSKIQTARGMRDRRMRLSLQVAKRFFQLQDMLGFAKASKTVEWLLNQSKDQINQIEAAASSKSNVSSSTKKVVVNGNHQELKRKKPLSLIKTKNSRKIHHPLAKELREKARERARERTKEKKMRRSNQSEVEEEAAGGTVHKFNQLGSWNPSCDFVTETNDLSSFFLSEEHLGTVNEAMMHIDHSCLYILSTS